MKQLRLFITLVIGMLAFGLSAQELPQAINFQAIARDASGQPLANTNIMLQLSVIDGTPEGPVVYREIRSLQTNAYGGFNFQLGREPNVANGVFTDIDWANGRKFLKVDYDPTGTISFNLSLGTIEFVSVPYAFMAGEVSIINATGASDGDVLVFNAATGKFVPQVPSQSGITEELDPTVPDWAKEPQKPTYDYSEILNTPEIPEIPENVSAFNNDAGYITSVDVPEIPTNVSAFVNDANYIDNETDPTVPAWAKESEKPVYDYSEITNKPEIPEVPSSVSAFTNDANYITAADIPENVSAFNNDANYITSSDVPAIPENVSAFNNDAGYLTSYVEVQALSMSGDTVFLTGGSYVVLPKEKQTLADVISKNNSANAQIKNVTDPTEAQDAATKAYIDNKIAELDDKIAALEFLTKGVLKGVFSVSNSTKVRFSKGNLQYQASTNTWRFAENQFDYIGSANSNISSSYSGWIDMFGWGTGGNPTNSSPINSDYSTFTDWGINPISNGGNQANCWRTLTNDEWRFLILYRTTSSGIRFAKATVNDVAGVIILPDDWSPSYYTLSSINTIGASFSVNTITSANWSSKFEAHGAVFLPVTGGYRYGTSLYDVGTNGYYWLSTPNDSVSAYYLFFYGSAVGSYNDYHYTGRSVRLVVDE